jgi:hypothetical protein
MPHMLPDFARFATYEAAGGGPPAAAIRRSGDPDADQQANGWDSVGQHANG